MRILWRWLPVVLWSALILSASNDHFSSQQTDGWLSRLLGMHAPELLHILLRKSGHILEYGILALLTFRAQRTLGVPMLVVLAVSSVDEWMQSRTAARTGTIWDVVLDCCAGFLLLAFLQSHRRTVSESQSG